nr:hypothetical protein [Candidatus Njordarchaeota archaeon]
MKEEFVISKFDIGIVSLKEEIRNCKTIWISNATTDFLKKTMDAFSKDAARKVLQFPGERKIENRNIRFKEEEMKIFFLTRNKEAPSMSLVLDECGMFTVFEDPVDHRHIVNEMLCDECSECFAER